MTAIVHVVPESTKLFYDHLRPPTTTYDHLRPPALCACRDRRAEHPLLGCRRNRHDDPSALLPQRSGDPVHTRLREPEHRTRPSWRPRDHRRAEG